MSVYANATDAPPCSTPAGCIVRASTSLIDVAEIMPRGWAVAGGQMVYLHCAQRGSLPERPSDDGDVVVDVHAHGYALRDFIAALTKVGFKSAGPTPQGYQHRWIRGDAQIDVLGPRHLDPFAARRDRATGLTTIAAPGAQHLLNRLEQVDVSLDGRRGKVFRPDLMGALASKAAAFKEIVVEEAKERHLIDVLTLAEFVSRRELSGREPWARLENRRLSNAMGAIRGRLDVQARFGDSSDRLDLLVLVLRYFEQ